MTPLDLVAKRKRSKKDVGHPLCYEGERMPSTLRFAFAILALALAACGGNLRIADLEALYSPEQVQLAETTGMELPTKLEGAQVDSLLASIVGAMKVAMDSLSDSQKLHVLLFVHGGMNSLTGAVAKTNELVPQMIDERYYPLFVNWRSGMWATFGASLIRSEGTAGEECLASQDYEGTSAAAVSGTPRHR